jgi:ribosomal protein L13E
MRNKWKRYLATLDDRSMSDVELRRAGRCFSKTEICHYGLLGRLARIIGRRERLNAIDEWLLRIFPWLGRYSQSALVEYIK